VTWFRVDDKFHDHPKTRRLRADKLPAAGLWSLAGSWAADNLTDGFVPTEIVQRFDPKQRYAKRLVEVGLWGLGERDGEDGYEFHEWMSWQPSKAEVLAVRASNARRSALHRDPELTSAVRQRDANRCRYCAVLVNWKDRRSGLGGTYDHVDPAGDNSFGNLVVACRSCNSAKGCRTPDEAGMRLLPPGTGPGGPPGGSDSASTPDLDPSQNGSGDVPEIFKTPSRPDPTHTKKAETKPSPPRSAQGDDRFDEFYAAYPRHLDRKDAERAWSKAIKTHPPDQIIDAAKRYAAACRGKDAKFIKYPATWLNKGGYLDEPDHLRLVAGGEQAIHRDPKTGRAVEW
jgi:hypothetical protein